MKKMNESRLLVTMVFGLMLGLLIIHPYNVMAAKPAGKDKKEVEANITHVHHLTLRGAYSEMPYTSLNPTALVMGGSLNLKSYFKLADHLEDLAKRRDVSCVVLDFSQPFLLSRVQSHDFLQRIAKLNKSGKKTIAWLASASTLELSLASACNEIFMSKDGMVDIPSTTMEHVFFKDLFNLVGRNVTAVRAGDFKGAVEPYTRSSISAPLRKHYEKMLASMNSVAVAQIAKGRKLPEEEVRQLQQNRLMLPSAAKEHGLIDRLVEPGRMQESVEARVGGKVEWGMPKKKKPKSFGLTDIFKALMSDDGKGEKNTKPTVVVYHLSGTIMDGHKAQPGEIIDGPTIKALNELREDEMVKGVVLRINSPGGSATASENIRVAISNLAKVKPIVFSMSDVAASGGYLVACVKAPIFADANTITGSIGVFGMQLGFDALLRRVGVNMETVAIDDAARQMQIGKPWAEEETKKLQAFVDLTYDLFLDRVSKARSIPVEKLKKIAGGRVWTGAQAKELGLVDKIGGLTAGINYVRGKAKLDKAEVKHLPKLRDGLDLSGLLGEAGDEIFHGELSGRLLKLNALGFNTQAIEFLLRNAHQSKARPLKNHLWMLQPMNFKFR